MNQSMSGKNPMTDHPSQIIPEKSWKKREEVLKGNQTEAASWALALSENNKYTQQLFTWFLWFFVQNRCLQCAKICPWGLAATLCPVVSWTRLESMAKLPKAPQAIYLFSFYSSLAKTEPTNLHPEEPKFEAQKYFRVFILIEPPNQNMQVETFAYFPHFQANMHFQFGFL